MPTSTATKAARVAAARTNLKPHEIIEDLRDVCPASRYNFGYLEIAGRRWQFAVESYGAVWLLRPYRFGEKARIQLVARIERNRFVTCSCGYTADEVARNCAHIRACVDRGLLDPADTAAGSR